MKRLLLPFFLSSIAAGQFLFAAEPFRFEENDKKQLSLTEGSLPILTYQYDVIEHEHVPKNNLRRLAGCYVHPLHGINGEILTDNAPEDHYHHHGVFWTWTHVGVHEPDGKVTEFSLWESNTALKQHFVRWIGKTITEQSATFEVENGWFIGDPKEGKKIMIERVKVIVHRIKESDGIKNRSVDFEFQWQPTDKPITLRGAEDKSYGGFTVRFKPFVAEGKKEAERSEINRITVPTGIADKDLPEMPLAWADYTSNFPYTANYTVPEEFIVRLENNPLVGADDTSSPAPITATITLDGKPLDSARLSFTPKDRPSGAAIFVPKNHPDFPPTWLTRYYGPLCVGWPGVKGQTFSPGEKIDLRYRIWIHDGAVTVPQIEKAYGEYNGE